MTRHGSGPIGMGFLVFWVAATAMGWTLGLRLLELQVEFQNETLSSILSTSLMFSPILLAGFGQWAVLHWRFRTPTGWLGATLGSCFLILLISPLLFALTSWVFPPGSENLDAQYFGTAPDAVVVLLGSLTVFALLGAAIAIPQSFVLRRLMKRSAWWIALTVLAWVASYPILGSSIFSWLPFGLSEIARDVIWGVVLGLVPGTLLAFMLRKSDVFAFSSKFRSADVAAVIAVSAVVVLGPILVFIGHGSRPCGWLDLALGQSGCISELEGYTFDMGGFLSSKGELFTTDGWVGERRVQFRRIPSGELVHSIDVGEPSFLALHPSGDSMATAYANGQIKLWDVREGIPTRSLGDPSMTSAGREVTNMVFSPDGSLLLVEQGGYPDIPLYLWRVSEGALVTTLDVPHPNRYAFSPDEKLLVIGARDGKLWLWIVRESRLVLLHEEPGWVQDVEFTIDGQTLIAAWEDRSIRLWDVSDWSSQRTLAQETETKGADGIILSSDGRLMVARSSTGVVQVWRVSDWSLFRTFEAPSADCVSIAPNGEYVSIAAYVGERLVYLWNLESDELVQEFEGDCGLEFSQDGSLLISTGESYGTLRVWEIEH